MAGKEKNCYLVYSLPLIINGVLAAALGFAVRTVWNLTETFGIVAGLDEEYALACRAAGAAYDRLLFLYVFGAALIIAGIIAANTKPKRGNVALAVVLLLVPMFATLPFAIINYMPMRKPPQIIDEIERRGYMATTV